MVSKVSPAESKKVQKVGKVTTNRPWFKRNVAHNNKTSSWKKHVVHSGNSKSQVQSKGQSDATTQVHSKGESDATNQVLDMFKKPTSWKALKAQIALANVMTKNNTIKLPNVDVWQHVPKVYRPCPKQE